MGFLPTHVERNLGITEALCNALDTPFSIKIIIIKRCQENRLRKEVKQKKQQQQNKIEHSSREYFCLIIMISIPRLIKTPQDQINFMQLVVTPIMFMLVINLLLSVYRLDKLHLVMDIINFKRILIPSSSHTAGWTSALCVPSRCARYPLAVAPCVPA